MRDFTGQWVTSFGPMQLTRSGNDITGSYGRSDAPNTLTGRVEGGRIVFDYVEQRERGSGWFELLRDGHFIGEYVADGARHPLPWLGNRGFDGIWHTSFGPIRLVEEGERVTGLIGDGATIEGRIEGTRLRFRDIVPGPRGEGTLETTADGYELSGTWNDQQSGDTIELSGVRAVPQPRLTWLIVLEAHWQRSLAEREFAFGDMLDEIFARLPHVEVRHRFFQDEASLLHWCRALQLLPEPVVLVITSHGEANGLHVMGKIIDSRRIIETLELADSLRLVHFSSCLVAKDGSGGLANSYFPVSGYTSSVDWMASALTEFTYLDMILGKGLPPTLAAEQVYRLIGFAGEEVAEGCPYPAAGFQLVHRKRLEGLPQPRPLEPMVATAGAGSGGFLARLGDLRHRLTGRGS